MKMRLLSYFAISLLFCGIVGVEARANSESSTQQQTQRITTKGKVVDANGDPLMGVTVREKGTSNGTMTNINGDFTLATAKGAVLEFSYIGFASVSHPATGATGLKVVLKEDSMELNEVVVTALGIKRQQKALSYNVQQIKSDELTSVKSANFVNALSGKVAGVTFNQSSSGVGSATKVVMRGTKSVEKSNNALYVIDGVPIFSMTAEQGAGQFESAGTTESSADINPDDIESISILTGAAAAALYGSAAANGAILITTKRGTEGGLTASYSFNVDQGTPFRLPRFQNRYGSNGNISSWGSLLPESQAKYRVEDFFQKASNFTHSLSVSAGGKSNQTYLSLSATNAKGLVPNNVYNRYNVNVRNTSSFLNDKLKLDASFGYIIQNHRNLINQGQYMNPLVSAYLMPRDENNTTARAYEKFSPTTNLYEQNWKYGEGDFNMQNPYWIAYRNLRDAKRERAILSLSASYDILKWSEGEKWNVAGRVRSDITHGGMEDKRYATTAATHDITPGVGYYGELNSVERQNYADIITSANKSLNLGNGHHLSLSGNLGVSIQDTRVDNKGISGPLNPTGIPNVFNIFNIDKTAKQTFLAPSGWIEQTQSIFASAEVGYNSYLYLTLTGRNDWASQLAGSPQLSFFYPSVGLSTVITEMLSQDVQVRLRPYISYLKLRAAYSSVASPFNHGLTSPMYGIDKDTYVYNTIAHFPVGKLFPERTDSYELGLSTRLFGGLLQIEGSLYRTYTKNQTIFTDVSSTSGYTGIYLQTGNVRNQGVELSATLNLGKPEALDYSTTFTLGYNQNRIMQLAENYVNPINGKAEGKDYLTKTSLGTLRYILKTGGSLGDIYTNADFARDQDGKIIVNQDGTVSKKEFGNNEMVKLGSVLPDFNLGWKHDLSWKGITLGAMFSARTGGLVVSMTQAAMDYYGVSEDSAIARDNGGVIESGRLIGAQSYFTTRGKEKLAQYYAYDATNIRLQELSLSYRIKRSWLANIADLSISLYGRNLAMLYCKAPFDPENISSTENYSQGLDYFMLPSQRTIGLSLKATF